jgi:hypothetical protein
LINELKSKERVFMKRRTQALLAFLILSVFSACPKNNNTPAATSNVYVNCVNCGGSINGQEFLTTESTEYNNAFVLHLGFNGDAQRTGPFYNVSQYQGVIAASRGDLTIMQGMYQGYCQIPVGTYSVGTLTAGQYGAGIIQGLRLVANGPVNLVINMDVAQIASSNNRDQNGILLPIQRLFSTRTLIESVNGQPCNLSVTIR